MPDNHGEWPVLDPKAEDKGKVAVLGIFERNSEWTTSGNNHYKNLYSALCGRNGAQALAQGTSPGGALKTNGAFELLAVTMTGEDWLIVTDGRDAVLVSRSAHGHSRDLQSGDVRRLWRNADAPRRSLEDYCRKS